MLKVLEINLVIIYEVDVQLNDKSVQSFSRHFVVYIRALPAFYPKKDKVLFEYKVTHLLVSFYCTL